MSSWSRNSGGPSELYAAALNQALARALDADVLLIGNWPAEPDGVEGLAESSPSRPADTLG